MSRFNLMLISVVIALTAIGLNFHFASVAKKKNNPVISNYAVRPDLFLENANRDLKGHFRKTAQKDIDKAIAAIRLIEKDVDDVSRGVLESAIEDLLVIRQEWENVIIDHDHISQTFAYALHSLAYAQMRVSEQYCQKGDMEKAKYALKYATEHLHNATRYADESSILIEVEMATAIEAIVEDDHIESQRLVSTIDALLIEMDTTLLRK